ncbi:MAG TPA: cyclic nucleotide-binding domain-containing protein, partial [Actinomycetota bacterium]|nr:cyclic nucleotide-binding domain-containing protein [Actinomycetota bacterium]
MSSLENPILDALEPRTRTRLLERSVPRRLAKGEFLYLAGDREPRVHVVVEGLLKFVGRDGSGVETTVGLAVSGDTAGEIAALDDLPQPLDAVAVVPTAVRGFAADAFMSAVTSDPEATAAFHSQMAARLRWA